MATTSSDGTSQAARRRPELDPAFAQLDDRTLTNLLAFARAYAGQLRYVNDQGKEQGDWQALFPDANLLALAGDFLRSPERFSATRAAPFARPHFALLLAFLNLLGLARDQLNALTGRHLAYFYRDVLHMAARPALADRLHVLLVPDAGVERLHLQAGTALRAGNDGAGRERLFRTLTEVVASPTQVAELRSLRVDIRTTSIREASRQHLHGGTRKQAFMAMWRIVLGSPLPGDKLPVPVMPGLPPPAPAGAPQAEVDFDTLRQADGIVAFVEDGLGLQRIDDFRRLMTLRRERLQGDAADWQRVNVFLTQAGQARDPLFVLPSASPDDFDANLRAALGLSVADYAVLYNRLPQVERIEDVYSLLDPEPEVQDFVLRTLRLSLSAFKAMMHVKLRIDGQWAEIAALIDAGGQRRDPTRVMTPAQRARRDVDALLAAAYVRLDWPVDGGLDGLHQALQSIEQYFCMSAEAFHFIMGVAQRSLALPPTQADEGLADGAAWARVVELCTAAHEALQLRRRREALQRAALPGLAAGNPAQALAGMLVLALGEPLTGADAFERLGELGMGAADIAALTALNLPANGAALAFTAEWQHAASVLEIAQRQREGFKPNAAERVIWNHLYPAADATAVRVPGQADDAPAPRWLPFGSLAAAGARETPPPAALGWALASPLLALAEGQRSVELVLGFDGDPAHFDAVGLRQLLSPPDGDGTVITHNPFQVQLSGAEGWVDPARVQLAWVRASLDGYPAVDGIDTSTLRALVLRLSLGEQQPGIVAPSAALHGLAVAQPMLRLMLNARWDEALGRHHSAYQTLVRLRLKRWRLAVSVQGLASLSLRNDDGMLDPKKPFEPFGLQPARGARLLIGHTELVGKALDAISFRGVFMGGPASLSEHYSNYDGSPKSGDFTLRIGLRDGSAMASAAASLSLFGGANTPGAVTLQPTLPPDAGRLLTEPPGAEDVGAWRRCWVWELERDLQHAAYPARALRKSMEMAAAVAAGEKPKADAYLVNPPYTPKLKSLVVDYSASAEQPSLPATNVRNGGMLHLLHPFGHEPLVAAAARPGQATTGWAAGTGVPLLPRYDAEGELYIGLAHVRAPQRLNLLVQVAEGSADPDAPREPVRWSVLGGNRWLSLQEGPLEGSLLADGTRGLLHAGIVELQLPEVAPSTLMPGADLPAGDPAARYWLRLSRQRAIEGVCDLVAVHPHAVLARRDSVDTVDDLSAPLPAGQVSGAAQAVPGLAKLLQPYSGFGGRSAERTGDFNTRVSERLRHRQRALTPWDYEHLVLEQFPQLYKVKCLRSDSLGDAPGRVDLVVVPNIANRFPFDPFAPKASADLIAEIETFLADKTPAFAQVRVKNPSFVALKVRCGVRFMPGTDEGLCRVRLGDELNRFLSPWAYDEGADLVIGGSIHANSIIDFIEQRDYVDYVAGLRMFTIEDGRPTLVPDGPNHAASTRRPDAVLVAAADHVFDVIALTDHRVQGFGGIGNMRIELDFTVA